VYDLAINPNQSGTWVILKGSPHESGVVYDLANGHSPNPDRYIGHIKRVSSMRAVWVYELVFNQTLYQVQDSEFSDYHLVESGMVYDLAITTSQSGIRFS
jgi:hypothetical protein